MNAERNVVVLCLVLCGCSTDPPAGTGTSRSAAVTTASSAGSSAQTAQTSSTPIATASKPPTALSDFLPPAFDGIALRKFDDDGMMPLPKGAAVGSYLNNQTRKAININLMPVQDLASSRAQFHGLKPGQTKEAPEAHLSFKAFEVKGYIVERTQYLSGSNKSEATILLADKVDVTLSVQPASDPDESIKLIATLDLAGIEAFAKRM